MLKVLHKRLVQLGEGASPYCAELICDDANELPLPDHYGDWIIDMGSIAHVINTGDTYCLNSSGDWKPQKKTESADVEGLIADMNSSIKQNTSDISTLQTSQQEQNDKTEVNRAALVDVLDSGAKNLLKFNNINDTQLGNLKYSINETEGTVTVTGSNNDSLAFISVNEQILPAGTYVVTGCPANGGYETYIIRVLDKIGGSISYANDSGKGDEFTLNQDTKVVLNIRINNNYTIADSLVFRPMICRKELYDVSSKFVPYIPNQSELSNKINKLTNNINNLKILTGTEQISRNVGINEKNVSFEEPFSEVPKIFITQRSNNPEKYFMSVKAMTKTGFTIVCYNNAETEPNETPINVDYMAIGVSSTASTVPTASTLLPTSKEPVSIESIPHVDSEEVE